MEAWIFFMDTYGHLSTHPKEWMDAYTYVKTSCMMYVYECLYICESIMYVYGLEDNGSDRHNQECGCFMYVHMYVVTHMQLHTDTLCMYMYVDLGYSLFLSGSGNYEEILLINRIFLTSLHVYFSVS